MIIHKYHNWEFVEKNRELDILDISTWDLLILSTKIKGYQQYSKGI
jgi:hypothetical protein